MLHYTQDLQVMFVVIPYSLITSLAKCCDLSASHMNAHFNEKFHVATNES